MDFDDLLEKTLPLLQEPRGDREHYQRQFQFILVDEYQDTNQLQSDFIDMLAARHHNVMVVGDDAQSIYSWRGANFRNILEFPEALSGREGLQDRDELPQRAGDPRGGERRHRARTCISSKRSSSPRAKAAAMKPALVPLADIAAAGAFVAQRMLELREEGVDLDEMAVLYRAHFHSMELQMELTRRGIPFRSRAACASSSRRTSRT